VTTSNSKNPLSSGIPAKVLIIEDEKDICYLLNGILRQKEIPTSLAGSLAEAEKLLHMENPEVIFLDNHLPDGFGIENIRKFKTTLPNSKIVMITAHDNPSDRQKAFKEGADYFISKPFTKDTIFQAIEQLKGSSGEKIPQYQS
jgi:CheY-like chemotaxis protein